MTALSRERAEAIHAAQCAADKIMLTNAFGRDELQWAAASPALFAPATIATRVRSGKAPLSACQRCRNEQGGS